MHKVSELAIGIISSLGSIERFRVMRDERTVTRNLFRDLSACI